MSEHERYFGAATYDMTEAKWRDAYIRHIDHLDALSPHWRERSVYVGDALYQETGVVFSEVTRSRKDGALLKARNKVADLERDLKAAQKELEALS
jgi:hypothetical protein